MQTNRIGTLRTCFADRRLKEALRETVLNSSYCAPALSLRGLFSAGDWQCGESYACRVVSQDTNRHVEISAASVLFPDVRVQCANDVSFSSWAR